MPGQRRSGVERAGHIGVVSLRIKERGVLHRQTTPHTRETRTSLTDRRRLGRPRPTSPPPRGPWDVHWESRSGRPPGRFRHRRRQGRSRCARGCPRGHLGGGISQMSSAASSQLRTLPTPLVCSSAIPTSAVAEMMCVLYILKQRRREKGKTPKPA